MYKVHFIHLNQNIFGNVHYLNLTINRNNLWQLYDFQELFIKFHSINCFHVHKFDDYLPKARHIASSLNVFNYDLLWNKLPHISHFQEYCPLHRQPNFQLLEQELTPDQELSQ